MNSCSHCSLTLVIRMLQYTAQVPKAIVLCDIHTTYVFCSYYIIYILPPTHPHRCENLKKDWERVRTLIGSKWAWLERRISELNKQICHLDYKIQRRPKRESTTFTSPRATTSTAPYLTVSNGGTLLEQIHRSGLKGGNGLSSPFLPQLLLPGGGVSNTKQLQVGSIDSPLSVVCLVCYCILTFYRSRICWPRQVWARNFLCLWRSLAMGVLEQGECRFISVHLYCFEVLASCVCIMCLCRI